MKRILTLLITTAFIVSFAACSSGQENSAESSWIVAGTEEESPSPRPAVATSTPIPTHEYHYVDDISEDEIMAMSEPQKGFLLKSAKYVLANEGKSDVSDVEVSLGDSDRINLSSLPVERLEWIITYLEGKEAPQATENQPEFDIDIYDEAFSKEGSLQFCLYSTIQELSRSLEWYVTQNNNPEVYFDTVTQELSSAHFYLDYFADCTATEARESVEEYTDTLIDAIQYAFPNIQIDQLAFFWKIPAVDEDNLYAARFFCEKEDGTIVRGDGSGLIY